MWPANSSEARTIQGLFNRSRGEIDDERDNQLDGARFSKPHDRHGRFAGSIET